jgi:O-antigen/teichoic acid export membrane protein
VALLATAILSLCLPFVTSAHSASTAQDQALVVLVGVSAAIYLATATLDGIAAGRQRFEVQAAGAVVGSIANLTVVILTLGPIGIVALGWGQLAFVLGNRVVSVTWVSLRERWFNIVPQRVTRSELRAVVGFAIPILVMTVGLQVIGATDLLVVGVVSSTAAVALYRVGTLAPNGAVALIFTGYDTVFPGLSATPDAETQDDITRFLTRAVCFMGGAIFGALILLRNDVVLLLSGSNSHLAASITIVFSAVWLVNLPVHGMSLLLIARGRQRLLVPLIVSEVVVNVGLTIAFVFAFGPIGAAIATLVEFSIADLLVFPWLVRHEFGYSPMRVIWLEGVPAIALGLAAAAVSVGPFVELSPSIERLLLGSGTTLIISVTAGLLLLGQGGRHRVVALLRRRATGASLPMPIDPFVAGME